MSRRAVIVDTNVVAAGLLTGNATSSVARILDGILAAAFPFVLSEALLAEYRDVLLRPALRKLHGLTVMEVEALLTDMAQHAIVLPPGVGSPAPDPSDQLRGTCWPPRQTRCSSQVTRRCSVTLRRNRACYHRRPSSRLDAMALSGQPGNFTHLRVHDGRLVRLGQLPERYFVEDPNTCLLKLRQLTELWRSLCLRTWGCSPCPMRSRPICCGVCKNRASSRAKSATCSTRCDVRAVCELQARGRPSQRALGSAAYLATWRVWW